MRLKPWILMCLNSTRCPKNNTSDMHLEPGSEKPVKNIDFHTTKIVQTQETFLSLLFFLPNSYNLIQILFIFAFTTGQTHTCLSKWPLEQRKGLYQNLKSDIRNVQVLSSNAQQAESWDSRLSLPAKVAPQMEEGTVLKI